MPKLPDMEVTDEQYERLLPVFNSNPQQYRRWLASMLIRTVIDHEVREMSNEYQEAVRGKQGELERMMADLADPPVEE